MILIAQLVGIVGIGLLVATFQVNKRRSMLRIQMLSGLVWVVHYVLLGALSGAGMNFLVAVRNFLFDRYQKQSWVFVVVIIGFVIVAILAWKNWTSILPLIGSLLGTLAFWQKNPRTIRFLSISVSPFWFAYNLLNGSYPGMVGDSVTFASVLVGIYRFDIVPLFAQQNTKVKRAKV
jgi:hypothetical protein